MLDRSRVLFCSFNRLRMSTFVCDNISKSANRSPGVSCFTSSGSFRVMSNIVECGSGSTRVRVCGDISLSETKEKNMDEESRRLPW